MYGVYTYKWIPKGPLRGNLNSLHVQTLRRWVPSLSFNFQMLICTWLLMFYFVPAPPNQSEATKATKLSLGGHVENTAHAWVWSLLSFVCKSSSQSIGSLDAIHKYAHGHPFAKRWMNVVMHWASVIDQLSFHSLKKHLFVATETDPGPGGAKALRGGATKWN